MLSGSRSARTLTAPTRRELKRAGMAAPADTRCPAKALAWAWRAAPGRPAQHARGGSVDKSVSPRRGHAARRHASGSHLQGAPAALGAERATLSPALRSSGDSHSAWQNTTPAYACHGTAPERACILAVCAEAWRRPLADGRDLRSAVKRPGSGHAAGCLAAWREFAALSLTLRHCALSSPYDVGAPARAQLRVAGRAASRREMG